MNTTEILATLKGLKVRVRNVRKTDPRALTTAHYQIAARCLSDVALFASRNPEHAEKRCWEARFHLNEAGIP